MLTQYDRRPHLISELEPSSFLGVYNALLVDYSSSPIDREYVEILGVRFRGVNVTAGDGS